MMIKELKLTGRKKLLGAIIICTIMITGLTMWYTRPVAEASILDPHPGLVGWWRFDEGTGTIAKDSSGNGNDGTIYSATWGVGKYGNASSFDGTDDYISITDDVSLRFGNDQFTMEFWLYVTDFSVQREFIRYKELAGTGYFSISITTDKRPYLSTRSSDTNEGMWWSPGLYLTSGWNHVVFTRIWDTWTCYLNATSKSVADTRTGRQETFAGWQIGKKLHFDFFKGIIDEVRIYNRALSAAEVQENFQKDPDFSSRILAKVPKGTTQLITTLTWQGIGSMNATIESLSETYTEDTLPVYQKSVYSSSGGDMLNIKRLVVSVTALANDESWYITLESDDVEDYKITVEVQR